MVANSKKQRNGQSRPLYAQIAERIRHQIASGFYSPEAQLPSEIVLTRDFGVSRVTIRQALSDLEDSGFIYKRHGVGTFVSGTPVTQNLSGGAQTIVEALRQQGIESTTRMVSLEHATPDYEVAEALQSDEDIVRLVRVFLNGSIPVAQATLYLPISMSGVAYVLAKDADKHTTYTVMEGSLGLKIKEAKHIIRTVKIDKSSADNLHMRAGDICLGINRTTYSDQGNPLEFTRLIYPPDRVCLEISLPRTSKSQVLTKISNVA